MERSINYFTTDTEYKMCMRRLFQSFPANRGITTPNIPRLPPLHKHIPLHANNIVLLSLKKTVGKIVHGSHISKKECTLSFLI